MYNICFLSMRGDPNYFSLGRGRGPSLNKLEPPLKVVNYFLFISPWERVCPYIEQRMPFTQRALQQVCLKFAQWF